MTLVSAWIFSVWGSPPAFADRTVKELEFGRIWNLVKSNSPAMKGALYEFEAAKIGTERAGRHGYPRVYFTGRAFATNDPGASFMYTLQQRQVGLADFTPTALNQPGNSFFEQGTLGIDLTLYEGGGRVAQAEAAGRVAEGKSWESKAQVISDYAQAANDYAALLILTKVRKDLLELREGVSGIVEHYTIGSKSNPVGYSGLLGLKNLLNRIDGLLVENEGTVASKRSSIQTLAINLPDDWQPSPDRSKNFLAKVFSNADSDPIPAAVQAARMGAEALERAKDGEKAKFLPKVGIFAQGDLYGGSRTTATSYTSGAYLQWDLFSAPNLGAVTQSEQLASAAAARADQLRNKMNGDHVTAKANLISTEKNIILLDESAKILEEQTQITRGLFRNGSINALQLVEVLNRRADLLTHRTEAELNLAQIKSVLFITTGSEGVPYVNAK
jgi:outer membrane protein TolC